MNRSDQPVIAVDIGGTKIISAVITGDGGMLSRVHGLTLAQEGPKKVIGRLVETVKRSIGKAGLRISMIGSICVAAAGIIDYNKGLITEAPNLPGWHNIPLRNILAVELDTPVFLLNDASAAALGEHRLGAGQGLDHLIYLTVSTGIGGGIIIKGELYNGADGCAAEIGHMILQVDGPPCKCGQRGCLEALASGTAIARMAGERLARGEQSILTGMVDSSVKSVTSALVSVAARKGDTLACGVIDAAAGYLGIGLANMVNIFNPQMIIIGGGVSRMGEMLLKPTRKAMKAHAFKLPGRTVRVVRPGLGLDAGLMGAAVYAWQKGEVTG